MEIKTEVTVKFSPDEVKEILKEHLKRTQNFDVTSVHFDINGHNQEGDWRAEYALEYRLDEVICNCKQL